MPELLDSAIQRRFERSFLVGMPSLKSRTKILQLLLSDCNLEESFDFARIASATDGYSPADILALSKAAVQISRRDPTASRISAPSNEIAWNGTTPRDSYNQKCVGMADFELALQTVYPTHWSSSSYGMLNKNQKQNYQSPTTSASSRSPGDNIDDSGKESSKGPEKDCNSVDDYEDEDDDDY